MYMDSSCSLPFKIGQQAESKSFQKGFRGAWFRCKINQISRKRGQIRYALEYFDYPDDREKWTIPFQRPHIGQTKRRKDLKPQLMLRPSFPPIYHESEASSILDAISEDILIARDFWKEGDMVDWFCEGCYWSGRVTRVLENNEVQVELRQPPEGEGGSYVMSSKDLRPSLQWSLELGWTVPLPKGRGTCCARLIRARKRDMAAAISGKENTKEISGNGDDGKEIGALSAKKSLKEDPCSTSAAQKRIKISGSKSLSCPLHVDSVESTIMDLEELANKVSWLKGLLRIGANWPNEMKPSWKFHGG